MQPSSRSPLRAVLDQFNEGFRQSGMANYLPDVSSALGTAGGLFAPMTSEATMGSRSAPQLARQVKQETPFPFAEDLGLYAAGGAAAPVIGAGIRAAAPVVSQAGRAVGDAASTFGARLKPAFQTPEVRNAALMRAIMEDPETTVRTVRSMGSAEDIIGGSGRFLSSRQTGTSPASPGGVSNYNPIREVAENATWGPGVDNVQYGYVTSPVLKNQPRPFQIGSGGREALQDYLKIAESMDDYLPALRYGQGQSKIASPVQYVLDPAVARNAQYFPTDSLLSQWKAGLGEGAPRITQSFDEFVRANQGVPNGYVEAAIPNLTINDISKINAMTGPETMRASGLGVKADAQSRMAAINKLLEQSGRDVPVGAITQWNSSFMPAGVSRSSAYQMPPTPRQQTSSALRNLQRRFNDTFVRPPVMPSTGVI